MPTKQSTGMAKRDGDIADTGATQQLKQSDGKRVPAENAPRPKSKPMMPGDVGA